MLIAGLLILIAIAAFVLYIGFKFVQSTTPKGFAYQLAKTQLSGYSRVKSNPKYTHYDDEGIFKIVLSNRHGYGSKEIAQIIKKAKTMSEYEGKAPDYKDFVMQLVLFDYEWRIGYIAGVVTGQLATDVLKAFPDKEQRYVH